MNIHYFIPSATGISDTINFVDSIIIKLKTAIPKCNIYFTLEGSERTKNATVYNDQFSVCLNLIIKALAYLRKIAS